VVRRRTEVWIKIQFAATRSFAGFGGGAGGVLVRKTTLLTQLHYQNFYPESGSK